MGNTFDVPLGQMASTTVVGWIETETLWYRQAATFLCMARQTLLPIVFRGILGRWLVVGIVAGPATHLPATPAITLTQCHRGIVLQQIGVWWRTALQGNSKDSYGAIQ